MNFGINIIVNFTQGSWGNIGWRTLKENLIAPFYGWDSTASRLGSHFEKAVYFLLLSFQEFLVLILSSSEGGKLTLEPPSAFENETPGLEIQHFNHKFIAPLNLSTSKTLVGKCSKNLLGAKIRTKSQKLW